MTSSSHFNGKEIFFSYNPLSSRDKRLVLELMEHLAPLKSEYPGIKWNDSDRIEPGIEIKRFLEASLKKADIIVLLLSASYLASERCSTLEMQPTLERLKRGDVHMLPVLLHPIAQKNFPLASYRLLPSNNIPISRWSNRDEALADVATTIRLTIEELFASTTAHSQRASLLTTPSGISDFFTDRDTVLATISSSFASAQRPNTLILALNGLPGIGKTQIAQAYASFSQRYKQTFWLNASSRALLSKDVSTYATRFSLLEDENELQLFTTFKHWLYERQGWLLVLDYLEDIALIDLVVPSQSHGHVLVTTRMQATGRRAFPVTIPSMDVDAGALFLLRRTKALRPTDALEQASAESVSKAKAIAQALNGFPLALEQAGAYIEEMGYSLGAYLSDYQRQRTRLLSERGPLADDNHQSLMSTFDLIFQQVTQKSPTNLNLLYLLAFLHPDAIFDELFVNGTPMLPKALKSFVADSQKLHQAFAVLLNFSLLNWSSNRTTLQMHRLVQDILIDMLTPKQQRHWAQVAVRLINYDFPEATFETWDDCQRYLPHAQHCAMLMTKYELPLKEGALLLERLGSFCSQHASYDNAEQYLLQALHLYERYWRTETLHSAETLNSLGLLYRQQARYKEAEACHRRSLELRKHLHDQDDSKTVESQHNLAMIYGDLGKYREAELLYLRVLSLEEHAKGLNHPDVADTLNELGLTYTQQGRFIEAETAYRRALTIYEHTWDASHPDLTYPLDGLGVLAEHQGNHQQAERLYQQAFAICLQAFGEKHPETAHSINKLAGIAASQNDNERAELLYQQALSIDEQLLGPRHPDVALILSDWGLLATKQKQYDKAKTLYERALDIYEPILGPEHPDVGSVLNNLGQLSYEMGDKEHAEKFLQRSLAIRAKAFDPTHPSIALSRRNLAKLHNQE